MRSVILILAALLAPAAKGRQAVAEMLPLIPAPRVWEPAAGTLPLASLVRMDATANAGRQAEMMSAWWDQATGRPLPPAAEGAPARGNLTLRVLNDGTDTAPQVPGSQDESWEMILDPGGVSINGTGPAGLFRGLQALRQLVLAAGPDGTLPCGRVAGAPRFRWRGMLLDSGRHLQDVALIREVIDLLALYGFNVLHWHLTEDQGWRLEVPGHPALTEVGAWRDAPDGGRYGGFYSAADVREVVAYAAERFITVVPEIELPGHAKAALAAYPHLSCTGVPFAVETRWGVFEDVYCAGNEDVFRMLGDVFDHVADLFPSRYVHIGGDEVPKDRWLACPRCRQRMEDEGLDGAHDLQSWFVGRAGRMLAERDRLLVGWDEILEGGLPTGATVQSWRGTRGAVVAARAGHDVVVSPTSHAYFDYDPRELPLEQVLTFDPVPEELEAEHHHRILGGALNLWTEYVPPEQVMRRLLPRLPAMAEALGAPEGAKEFSGFLSRLRCHEPFWKTLGLESGAASRPLEIRSTGQGGGTPRLLAHLRGQEHGGYGDAVLQTWTGMAPLPADWQPVLPSEAQPLPEPVEWTVFGFSRNTWPERGDVLAMARLETDGPSRFYGAPAVLEIHRHLAVGRPVRLAHPPSGRYPGRGEHPLTDGVRGSVRFDDGLWSGFEAVDMDASLDLGVAVTAPELSVRCVQDANAWIFLPRQVRFEGSLDGKVWHPLGTAGHDVPDTEQRKIIQVFSVRTERPVRHVRVVAENYGPCPDWHPGRGQAVWIFVDEIRIRP